MNFSDLEPLDDIHRLSLYALAAIREDFQAARARVALWEPRECPHRAPLWTDPRIPYLDEIQLPRKWFR